MPSDIYLLPAGGTKRGEAEPGKEPYSHSVSLKRKSQLVAEIASRKKTKTIPTVIAPQAEAEWAAVTDQQWTKDTVAKLLYLCQLYDCKFFVIQDLLGSITVDQLKAKFYSIQKIISEMRSLPPVVPEYDLQYETQRKTLLEKAIRRDIQLEKTLLTRALELKRLEREPEFIQASTAVVKQIKLLKIFETQVKTSKELLRTADGEPIISVRDLIKPRTRGTSLSIPFQPLNVVQSKQKLVKAIERGLIELELDQVTLTVPSEIIAELYNQVRVDLGTVHEFETLVMNKAEEARQLRVKYESGVLAGRLLQKR